MISLGVTTPALVFPNMPEVENVNSLKGKDDFLMQGVVLQIHVFRPFDRCFT